MQLQNQSCASASPLALIAGLPAPQPPREQRLNRASRGLNGQFINGAPRRLKSQRLEGASRRLNSQSMAVATAALQLSGWLPAEPAGLVPALTGRPKWGKCASGSSHHPPCHPCGLTPRSSRAPTACHAGPAGGTLYIFANRARAPHRRCRLNSNVRQRRCNFRISRALRCHFWPSSLACKHRSRLGSSA